jgi:hypothetical protein
MLVFSKPATDFSRWCVHPATRARISATHPLPIRELTPANASRSHRNGPDNLLVRHLDAIGIQTVAVYLPGQPFGVASGRSHRETRVGCIVSLTTPTRSPLSASRSVSSLSLTEKASRVFLASYFLL